MDHITKDKRKPKDVVLVNSIRPLFTQVLNISELKERNVNILWLGSELFDRYNDKEIEHLIFLLPPNPDFVK